MPQTRTLVIAAGAVLAAAVLILRPWGGAATPARQAAPEVDPATEARFRAALEQQQTNPALDPRQEAERQVGEYRRRYEADTQSPDAPALLSAMGNLAAQKLGDDAEAIRCYELIVLNHPDWPEARAVYPLLEAAYERTRNLAQLNWLYQEMMKRFPEDAQEYLYAKAKLGL